MDNPMKKIKEDIEKSKERSLPAKPQDSSSPNNKDDGVWQPGKNQGGNTSYDDGKYKPDKD